MAKFKKVMNQTQHQTTQYSMLGQHLAMLESIGANKQIHNNKVTLLVDGPATYDAMFTLMENAKKSINMESYIIEDDEIGNRVAEILLKKQYEGIDIHLIYDSLGSRATPNSFFDRLRSAGIKVLGVRPLNPFNRRFKGHCSDRDHRKILVVDSRSAITGGINISHKYSSAPFSNSHNKPHPEKWRDTDIQIDGPAAMIFEKMFFETWRAESKDMPNSVMADVGPAPEGQTSAIIVGNSRGKENRVAFMTYLSAFMSAKESIYITNSYFVPDKQTQKALIEAAKRGVDVKIILPGKSDVSLALYAGRHLYKKLLKSGIKLYENDSGILHAKTAVVDGVWSTIGSTNLDNWSLANNDEVNAVILGNDFAKKMEDLFNSDLDQSLQIDLEKWKKRSTIQRIKEVLAYFVYHL